MCGIAGIVHLSSESSIDQNLERMLDKLKHRGPDNRGLFHDRNILLGHQRLSIIDLSEESNQPLIDSKQNVLVFNGEIYNYRELRTELESLGHEFKTKSDTEVLLHSYQEWGSACTNKFRGMWAFSLLDREKNILFCSRDRFGIKPFYYLTKPESFIFASEMKAIHHIRPQEPNLESFGEYLLTGLSDHRESTFFGDIKELRPGHNLILNVDSLDFTITRYYYLEQKKEESNLSDFKKELRRSIELHLRSDVKVATCLSGGVDSSAVCTLSAQIMGENHGLESITAGTGEKKTDEISLAKKVADRAGVKPHTLSPSYEDFKSKIETCLSFQEAPVVSPSVFMQYSVMEKASKEKIKVMLSGQGGDEALLGYERYYVLLIWRELKHFRLLSLLKLFRDISNNSKLSVFDIILYFGYFLIPSIKNFQLLRKGWFVKKSYKDKVLSQIKSDHSSFLDPFQLQVSELTKNQLPRLLRYEDRNSMAFSIEGRVPLVDHLIIETATSLPLDEKIKHGYTKYPLRKAIEKICPADVVWKKDKLGFESPENRWFDCHQEKIESEINNSKILKEICNTIPSLSSLSARYKWRLYNIAIWEKVFTSK